MLKTKRKTYGNTWWGQAWVEALEGMGTNRLMRGKTYANAGRVKNIKISDGKLSASVKGSYYGSYNIKISLEKFSKNEIKKIKEIITENSSIAIELGMGNLPESLLELIKKEKITLLPKIWRDLKSSCSCPDSANPCKHLAAVYYMLANEIDKDPFIIFNLKGIEKKELIDSAGVETEPQKTGASPLKNKFVDLSEVKFKKIEINIDDFEFSFPKYDIKPLLSLLTDNPPFYNEGNFKTFIENIYKIVAQKLDSSIPEVEETSSLSKNQFQLEFVKDGYRPRSIFRLKIVPDKENFDEDKQKIIEEITTNHLLNYQKASLYDYNKNPPNFVEEKATLLNYKEDYEIRISKAITPQELKSGINYFLSLPVNIDYDIVTESFAFLNILASMSLGLVRANLYLPEVVFEEDEAFSIRYIPLVKDEQIRSQIEKLKQIVPADICNRETKFLSEDGIYDLVSLFITNIVKKIIYDKDAPPKDKIAPVFIYDYLFRAHNFAEKNIANSISNWLEKLYISKKDICPVIRIESRENDNFGIFVDVITKKNSLEHIAEYKKVA